MGLTDGNEGLRGPVGARMKDKNLCLIAKRFETINTDDKVLIPKLDDVTNKVEPVTPIAQIPVGERKTDREACLLAMAWLREHRHITTLEYFREVEKFMFSEAAHPTEAVECPVPPRRRRRGSQ